MAALFRNPDVDAAVAAVEPRLRVGRVPALCERVDLVDDGGQVGAEAAQDQREAAALRLEVEQEVEERREHGRAEEVVAVRAPLDALFLCVAVFCFPLAAGSRLRPGELVDDRRVHGAEHRSWLPFVGEPALQVLPRPPPPLALGFWH